MYRHNKKTHDRLPAPFTKKLHRTSVMPVKYGMKLAGFLPKIIDYPSIASLLHLPSKLRCVIGLAKTIGKKKLNVAGLRNMIY